MFIPPAMPSSPSSPELVHSEPNPNPIPEPEPNPESNTSHNAPSSPPQTTTNKPPPTAAEIAARYILQSPPLSFAPKPLSTSEVTAAFGVIDDLPSLTDEEQKPLSSILTTSSGDQFSGTSWWSNQLETGISALADLADLANPSDDDFGYQGYSIHTNLASYNSRKPFEIDNGGWSPVDYGYNFNNFFATASSPRSPSLKSVGAGITNMGNTCFMSAILQCFTHTVQMFLGLRYCTHASSCDVEGFCVICAFRDHLDDALERSRSPIVPRELVKNLNYFSAGFVIGNQEDAHEFMQYALNKLKRGFPVGEENLIDQIFGGRLVSKLRCCCCGHSSDKFEPLIDMSLEIEHVSTIQQALESFTKVEKMDGKFICSDCNQEVTMEKQLMLDKAPSVAAFHLKRFLKDGDSVKKIDKYVDFSKELDLKPYTCGSSSGDNVLLKYELYAVVEHRGPSPNSGHYFSFVRSAPDKWYLMDDDKVSSVSEEEVLNRKAYILFYAQQGTPWFSSIVENEETAPKSKYLHNKYGFDCDNNGEKDDNDSTDANYDNCVSDMDEECDSGMQDVSP
ncbi:ubiquitin carboxyl-terminal hydrolase [Medicago truncatula]|nr:ubiquitin carboxyl-terminal hydrolase [Medicago truncatula]